MWKNILKKENIYKIVLPIIFIFGIYVRVKYFMASNVFEDDECRLALSMMNKPLWQMLLPTGPWSSTPVFTFFSKIIAECTNYSEMALEFIPLLSSIACIFAFYKLSEEYFKRKISVLMAVYLISVNFSLLYFAAVFKTYSLDVLIGILCLYYLPKINVTEYNNKKLILTAAILSFLPLLSISSVFFIGSFFCINIFENLKNKIFWKKFAFIGIPFTLIMTAYYFMYLNPAKIMMLGVYDHFYDLYYAKSFYEMCAYNLNYFFNPSKYFLLFLILICLSFILIIFNKNFRNKIDFYIISTAGFAITASVLHIYPLIGRTGLFLISLAILLILKPFDSFDIKKPAFYINLVIITLCLYVYLFPSYMQAISNVSYFFIHYSPKVLIKDLYQKYDKDNDVVILNEASLFSFLFYMEKYKMYDLKYDFPEYQKNGFEEYVYSFLNNLPKNKNYWFYAIKEFRYSPETKYMFKWLQGKKAEYKRQDKNSYLLYYKF